MTAGAAICVVGTLFMRGIGPDARYVTDVVPGVMTFGLGLALLVAPLTATVLAAAARRRGGHRVCLDPA